MSNDMAGFPTPAQTFTDLIWDTATKGSGVTLAFGSYKATSAQQSVKGNLGKSTGRWYFEIWILATSSSGTILGVGNANALATNYPGSDANGYGFWSFDGTKYNAGVSTAYDGAWATNDVIGVLLDCGTGALNFYVNNVDKGIAFTLPLGITWFQMFGGGGGTAVQGMLMSSSTVYAPPTNAKRWSNFVQAS